MLQNGKIRAGLRRNFLPWQEVAYCLPQSPGLIGLVATVPGFPGSFSPRVADRSPKPLTAKPVLFMFHVFTERVASRSANHH